MFRGKIKIKDQQLECIAYALFVWVFLAALMAAFAGTSWPLMTFLTIGFLVHDHDIWSIQEAAKERGEDGKE